MNNKKDYVASITQAVVAYSVIWVILSILIMVALSLYFFRSFMLELSLTFTPSGILLFRSFFYSFIYLCYNKVSSKSN